jgi:hypothetical protein
MSAPTFTDQATRNLAGRLRAANCEPGTDRDGFDASYAIEQLLRERGALTARLDVVARAVHDVTHDTDGGEVDGNLPAEEVRRVLYGALEEVAW